ncbi:MAG: sigma-70 family RNA polymerase sigma factor [Pseudomonadales bacterium]|nr:sigma-70 family RNA polymerase sigma factor [Pseudomonadales bacterium]
MLSLVQTQQSELLAFLTQKLSSHHDAEDVYQSLFIKLSESSNDTLNDVRDPRSYLFRMANNMAIDLLRKRNRTNNGAPSDIEATELNSVSSPERIFMGQQQAAVIKATIAAMPAKRRQVFLLFKFKNVNRQAIAQDLGLSIDAVDKHLVRALKDCKDSLEEANDQP